MPKRILFVTGAGGFLGERFLELARRRDWELRCLTREISPKQAKSLKVNWIRGTLENPVSWRKALKGCDMILHLAAMPMPETEKKPLLAVKVIVGGMRNLLNEGRHKGIKRFIIASTGETYGSPVKLPVKESQVMEPLSYYGYLKANADLLALLQAQKHDLSVLILRFFNVYGRKLSGEFPMTVTRCFIDQLNANKPIILHASKLNSRDFIYIEDAARAIVAAVEKEKAKGIINIASGKETFLIDLAKKLARKMKKKCVIDFRPNEGRKRRLVADVSRAKKHLGFKTKVSLDQGLNEVLNTRRKD